MFFILALLLPIVNSGSVDCSLGKSVFKLNSVNIDPVVPIKNENFTVSLDYTVPEGLTITSGTAVYSMTYNFLPFSPSTDDLCKDTSCPIIPGPHSQSSTSIFPSLTGTIVIKTQWFDDSNTQLLCYSLNLKV